MINKVETSNHLQPGKRFYRGGLIDLSEYALVPAEADAEWDLFISRSPESSIFVHSAFLAGCGERVELHWCLKGQARVAAVALPLDRQGQTTFDSALIYNGVLTAQPDPKQNIAQVRSDRFALLAFLSEALSERHPRLKMRLAPQLDDLRPFLWHNYGQPGAKFRTEIRYTSVVPAGSLAAGGEEQETALYLGMSKSRRQTLRYARKEQCETVERHDPALYERLQRETFARQNLTIDDAELAQRVAIIEALHAAGLARSFVCALPGAEPEVIAVFAHLGRRAWYLFGAGGSERHDSNSGTALLWDGFAALAAAGIEEIDLEGVNSPARGYFKLSFGGSLSPYYALALEGDAP
jgi:hypothetical protein